MRRRVLAVLILLGMLCISCTAHGAQLPTEVAVKVSTEVLPATPIEKTAQVETSEPTETVVPKETLEPTQIPKSTDTPEPTETLEPTPTLEPTDTPELKETPGPLPTMEDVFGEEAFFSVEVVGFLNPRIKELEHEGMPWVAISGAYWHNGIQKPGFSPGEENPWNMPLPPGRYNLGLFRDSAYRQRILEGDLARILTSWDLPSGENKDAGYLIVYLFEQPFVLPEGHALAGEAVTGSIYFQVGYPRD